jgi:3-oxoacyl-[acyl-carrier protein] reductase
MATQSNPRPLEGKTALVTGASRGIGRAIAVELARLGASVGVNFSEDSAGAAETANLVQQEGVKAAVIQGDVSNSTSAAATVEEAGSLLGDVEVLVCNAGIRRDGLALRMTDEAWDDVVATNLSGAFYVTRAALKSMIRKRWGRLVYISSVAGVQGNAGQANYAASKAGLIGLAKSIAREVGSRGITANVVAPGFVETDMTADLSEELLEQARSRVAAGRLGKPDDIAPIVGFLCSPGASYLNGTVITVDGGL